MLGRYESLYLVRLASQPERSMEPQRRQQQNKDKMIAL
jgi:hypothetical protein